MTDEQLEEIQNSLKESIINDIDAKNLMGWLMSNFIKGDISIGNFLTSYIDIYRNQSGHEHLSRRLALLEVLPKIMYQLVYYSGNENNRKLSCLLKLQIDTSTQKDNSIRKTLERERAFWLIDADSMARF